MRFPARSAAGAGLLLGVLAPGALAAPDEPAPLGSVDVAFDIAPGICPNPVKITPGLDVAVFPTAIVGSDSLPASSFSTSSLILVLPGGGGENRGTEILPIMTEIDDVATPFTGTQECGCTSEGADGTNDLAVAFDLAQVTAALSELTPGQQAQVCIVGDLVDGRPFEGCDCVFVVGPLPVPVSGSTWGTIKATYRQ